LKPPESISEGVDEEVRRAVIVVIGEINAHTGVGFSVFVIGEAHARTDFREGAVAVVAKELLRE
jgi:hypothetical protein